MSGDTLNFTVSIGPDPEHPKTWVATCHELGVVSAARSPQRAFAALGSAVRFVVCGTTERRGTPDAGLDVLREIVAGVTALRETQPYLVEEIG
jgi:hypothetical protein